MQKLTLLALLLCVLQLELGAQCLSGQYTLGKQGDFKNFDSLQQVLNNFGICGPTRILLLPERHEGGLQLGPNMGINLSNTFEITAINGQKDGVLWQKTLGSSNVPLLNLNGVQGVWVHDLNLFGSNSTLSIRAQDCQNLRFERCAIENTEAAIWFKNVSVTQFKDCKIQAKTAATFFELCAQLEFEQVQILQPLIYSSDPSFFLFQCTDSQFENGFIHGTAKLYDCHRIDFQHNELFASAPPTTFSDGGFWAQDCDSLRISNNAFYDEGLINADLVTLKQTPASFFVHNSAFISTAKAALFIEQSQSSNKLQVLNNIITGAHPNGFPYKVMGDPTAYLSDYNCIWSEGPDLIAVGIGNLNQNLVDWQTNFQQDAHSTVSKPTFLSPRNLKIKGNLPELSGKALYLPNFSATDLDGDPRPAGFADIGTDQFSNLATDARIVACNLPNTNCHGSPSIAIQLKNEGPDTLRNAWIYWKINGDTTLAPFHWKGLLASGQISNWIEIGQYFNYKYASNTLELRVEASRDANISNNIWSIASFSNRMGGDYTVGGLDADFAQLEDAARMLATAGVCGPVQLNLRKSAQNAVLFGSIPGSTPARTVSVQPENSGLEGPFLEKLELKTVKNVKFKRLNLGETLFSEGPNRRIEFSGCLFEGLFEDASLGDSGMVLNQCFFPQNPVTIQGSPQTLDRAWRIENCVFGNDSGLNYTFLEGDLDISFMQGLQIRNCRFRQTANTWIHNMTGGMTLENNRFGSSPALQVGFCTGTANDPVRISNNFFHFKGIAPINLGPTVTPQVNLFDLKYAYFLHNSVHYSTENSIFDEPVAILIYDWENGRFEGNLVKTGGSAMMFDFYASWFINVLNHNNYDLGPEGVIPGYQSLASWQNLTGLDLQTTGKAVKFEAENDPSGLSTDLHLTDDSPNKPLTINLQAGILTDIDGQTRSLSSPAIGADEPGGLPQAGLVWPGDCDADLQVSSLDWLQLGVAIGQNLQGPARADASIGWSPKYAADWPDSIQNVNGKHADCDGSGQATVLDTLAIVQNFGEEHFLIGQASDRSGTAFKIELPAGPYYPGQKIEAPMLLGTTEEAFYGLALQFSFSASALASGSFWVDFQNSWLGQNGVNLMGFYRKNPVSGHYPVAMVKTDGQNATGFGQVGTLHFTIGTLADSLKIEVVQALGILSDGQQKPIEPAPVLPVSIALSQHEIAAWKMLRLWPNPSAGLIHLEFPEHLQPLEVTVFDALGRVVWAQKTSEAQLDLDLVDLPSGPYQIRILGENGGIFRMFVLER